MSTSEHKKISPDKVTVGVITVSTTRTIKTDKSGEWIVKRAVKEGHDVILHKVVPDDRERIRESLFQAVYELKLQAVLFTGGTGISDKDVTIEAVKPFFHKELTAFGTIFTQLSYEEIDSAAILSRATAGIIDKTVVFCMPGSLKSCKLACKTIIFPELGHLVKHIYE
ncbi:MAG: MogA/MoaB family molybdenum cofactor biosynthesis protein [Proteobacteria bacterium]|nr:MogA/MoaB family molybdenum cofactor biosynthesis protein [Pseudomonadota bacterium]